MIGTFENGVRNPKVFIVCVIVVHSDLHYHNKVAVVNSLTRAVVIVAAYRAY